MFCIAAFIVLALLSVFSAKYRRLAGKAWKCVARKTTFRKCDTSFKEEMKSHLLGSLVVTRPKLARFLDKWLDVLAFIFVALTIWSLLVVAKSGLNLYVHGTCNPSNSESCSLGAEACSIETVRKSFYQSVKTGDIFGWFGAEASDLGETIGRIPDRMKKWNPRLYTTKLNSYYLAYDSKKPVALEIIDPSCQFCSKLFKNLKQASVQNRYNLTYIVYPIPSTEFSNGYKFRHSYFIATYLEAIKLHPLKTGKVPADWQVLERIFTWQHPKSKVGYQSLFNTIYSENEVRNTLQTWLKDMGYSEKVIAEIAADTKSAKVKASLKAQREVVEERIKTVKIPTLLLNTKRFDGVVGANRLQ